MNRKIKYAQERILGFDRRAYIRRVMWLDFEERLYDIFQKNFPDTRIGEIFGGVFLSLSLDNNPEARESNISRINLLNSAQIFTGLRLLGIKHFILDDEKIESHEIAQHKSPKLGLEKGATLFFSQDVTGTISIFLAPYDCFLAKVQEKNILLVFGMEPHSITEVEIEKYIGIFVKYCVATSAHSAHDIGSYFFRLRLRFKDRRNRLAQGQAIFRIFERLAIFAVGVSGVLATLYTGGKWIW